MFKWLALFIVLAGILAYANGLSGPFIYDDIQSIPQNEYIRQLRPLWRTMLSPPQNTLVHRPIVSLSLALNYAVSGPAVWGYHVFNVAVHLISALLLAGIVRRTLLKPVFGGAYSCSAPWLALLAGTIWMLHPLQTDAVTYLIQRTELLMAMFYLSTLYFAIRGWESLHRWPWFAAAVVSCSLGMGSKEVMVSAPLIVLLYDRTFVSGSLPAAMRRHRGLYAGLAATWLILGGLMLAGPQNETVGFHLGIGPLDYLRTQAGVLLWYLRLCIWPDPLVIAYNDWPLARDLNQYIPQGLVILSLLGITAWALWRRSAMGFLGAWFFLILAPTSSFLPIVTEVMAERRMYLPLAAVVVFIVMGGYKLLTVISDRSGTLVSLPLRIGFGIAILIAIILGQRTAARNRDYRTAVSIWSDAVAKRPGNAASRAELGNALREQKRYEDALASYLEALRISPEFPDAHNNLADLLRSMGRVDEAIAHYQETLRIKPDHVEALTNYGVLLANLGKGAEGVEYCTKAVQIKPNHAGAHNNLGALLAAQGKLAKAIEHCTDAVRLQPDFPEAHNNLANALASQGQADEAIRHYKQALQLKPDYPEAHNNLAMVLTGQGKPDEAVSHYKEAIRLKPDYPRAHEKLGLALIRLGLMEEAIKHLAEAIRLKPDSPDVHANLGNALLDQGNVRDAIQHFEEALRLKPDATIAINNLAWALATHETSIPNGRERAIQLAEKACEQTGYKWPDAIDTLAAAYAAGQRFTEAVRTAQRAIEQASSAGDTGLAENIRGRLRLYEAGQPYRAASRINPSDVGARPPASAPR